MAAHPAIGEEIERHGSVSWRVLPLTARLPFLVWYVYDEDDADGPVSLVLLMHERQERAAGG